MSSDFRSTEEFREAATERLIVKGYRPTDSLLGTAHLTFHRADDQVTVAFYQNIHERCVEWQYKHKAMYFRIQDFAQLDRLLELEARIIANLENAANGITEPLALNYQAEDYLQQ